MYDGEEDLPRLVTTITNMMVIIVQRQVHYHITIRLPVMPRPFSHIHETKQSCRGDWSDLSTLAVTEGMISFRDFPCCVVGEQPVATLARTEITLS